MLVRVVILSISGKRSEGSFVTIRFFGQFFPYDLRMTIVIKHKQPVQKDNASPI